LIINWTVGQLRQQCCGL